MSKNSFNLLLNNKISAFKKIIKVDADKSISIRILIGAICQNISVAENILELMMFICNSVLKRLEQKLKNLNQKILIYGRGLGSLTLKRNVKLNFGNLVH